MRTLVLMCALFAATAQAERFKYPDSAVQEFAELIGHKPELMLPGMWSGVPRRLGTFMWARDTLYVAGGVHKIAFELPCSAINDVRFGDKSNGTVIADVFVSGDSRKLWIYTTWPDGSKLIEKLQSCASAAR